MVKPYDIRVEIRTKENGEWEKVDKRFKWVSGASVHISAYEWIQLQQKIYNYDFKIINTDNNKEEIIERPFKNRPYGRIWYSLPELKKTVERIENSIDNFTEYIEDYRQQKWARKNNERKINNIEKLNKIIDRIELILWNVVIEFIGYNPQGYYLFYCKHKKKYELYNEVEFEKYFYDIREIA